MPEDDVREQRPQRLPDRRNEQQVADRIVVGDGVQAGTGVDQHDRRHQVLARFGQGGGHVAAGGMPDMRNGPLFPGERDRPASRALELRTGAQDAEKARA
ncbi:hypothetical protein IFM12275_40470 [Nocardia sputorum]|uniref:Uncharacterized protein n=1 Tax=Nocardia sputorum TaxID=2984338 RepID=A0ABN6UBG4_9NOCA|nr:hypothetical protein IFM12275_40470 [Nocardia sputorum]BDU02593.1 hypothetical protein IFM12276_56210 [Nocardia sputorum]